MAHFSKEEQHEIEDESQQITQQLRSLRVSDTAKTLSVLNWNTTTAQLDAKGTKLVIGETLQSTRFDVYLLQEHKWIPEKISTHLCEAGYTHFPFAAFGHDKDNCILVRTTLKVENMTTSWCAYLKQYESTLYTIRFRITVVEVARILFASVHLPYTGVDGHVKQAQIILRVLARYAEICKRPIFIGGDFNADLKKVMLPVRMQGYFQERVSVGRAQPAIDGLFQYVPDARERKLDYFDAKAFLWEEECDAALDIRLGGNNVYGLDFRNNPHPLPRQSITSKYQGGGTHVPMCAYITEK